MRWSWWLLLFSIPAWAGQPWFGNTDGVPFHWKDGAIAWTYDGGELPAGMSNAKALKMLQDAFGVWANEGLSVQGQFSSTASISSVLRPMIDQDLTLKNFQDYVCITGNTCTSTEPATFIFDYDQSILNAILGEKTASGVMGYTHIDYPVDMDMKAGTITRGFVVLNGKQLEKQGVEKFKASVLHEIGHLLGLDHSGLNHSSAVQQNATGYSVKPGMSQTVPTMYPITFNADQYGLNVDDVVTMSSMYPSSAMKSQFCTLKGTITDKNGVGIQGIEVVVRSALPSDQFVEAISTMSGGNYPVPTRSGLYYVHGIVPNRQYNVGYTTLPEFKDGSSIGMFSIVGASAPSGFTDGEILSGGVATVSCSKGGQTILMDNAVVEKASIDPMYASAPIPKGQEGVGPAPAPAKSGGCSLIR